MQEDTRFDLDVYIAGQVSLSSGTLFLSYDPEVLEYVESEDAEQVTATETEAGELEIHFDYDTGIKEKTQLSKLTFYAKPKDAYATRVDLKAGEMKVTVNGQEQPADCATINNKIYFLQEVDE